MKLTTIFLVALLVLTVNPGFAAGFRFGDTPAARIAKDRSLPGKGQAGQCLPFAQALHRKFQAAGIASQVVVYGYETGGAPAATDGGEIVAQPAGARASHAVVIYDDGGRTYVMDNQSWTPKWIHNAAPVQMAQQFSGLQCQVRMARVVGEESHSVRPAFRMSGMQLAER